MCGFQFHPILSSTPLSTNIHQISIQLIYLASAVSVTGAAGVAQKSVISPPAPTFQRATRAMSRSGPLTPFFTCWYVIVDVFYSVYVYTYLARTRTFQPTFRDAVYV